MFALSLNFKTANIALREGFAFNDEKVLSLLNIFKNNNIDECVYLCTCNRCEIYGVGDEYTALKIFCDFAKASSDEVKSHIFVYSGKNAVVHLFRVCCGFESMVFGEDEILGQIKKAFSFSQNNNFTDFELNTIFKSAITSAKKIKTQTLISKSSVSIATLVASKSHKFIDGKKNVLLIGGSGEIGSKVLKDLISYNEFEIYATTREQHNTKGDVHIIPYANRYDYVNSADIIISATKSPHFTIVADKVKSHIKNDKERLFIDLAVPRDIDDEVKNNSNNTLMQIDDFEEIANNNKQIKLDEYKTAEDLMNEDIDTLLKELCFHSLLPKIQKVKSDEIKRFIYTFRDTANASEFESFANVFAKCDETRSLL
jgi:glutamyl-tRNA reductase